MLRRRFIRLLGGGALWPIAARAQGGHDANSRFPRQRLARSVRESSPHVPPRLERNRLRRRAKRRDRISLGGGHNERLPALAADLVHRKVSVIAVPGTTPAALAAKAATATTPIVFFTAGDPVALGLVASLNRPGGNLAGTTSMGGQPAPKRLELLHESIPSATVIGLLVNPTNPALAEATAKELQAAARSRGLQVHTLHASTERDFDSIFATLIQLRASALVIGIDSFFTGRRARRPRAAARARRRGDRVKIDVH